MIIEAQKQKLDLTGTTVFLNLMPCPTCTRMLCDTDIAEVVYTHDHSDGYALKLLTEAGKKVRRSIPA
jgi:deoxycytidylate deaminase